MRFKRFLAIGVLVGACGATQPPRGPSYTPVNSPEPQTSCGIERDKAKAAREVLLETPSATVRAGAAGAVLVHAECELGQFRGLTIPPSSQNALMLELRALRGEYLTSRNLLDEVLNYKDPKTTVGALAVLGTLDVLHGQKLRAAPVPVDVPADMRSGFREELTAIARDREKSAALAFAAAVDAADRVKQKAEVSSWLAAACSGLANLDPAASRRRVLCAR